jgi:aminomethyltransferase
VLARDIRTCRPGQAHYTIWSDDDGYVIEDGVILRLSQDEFLLTAAEPNLAYLKAGSGVVGEIEDESDAYAASPSRARAREILVKLAPEIGGIGYFQV